MATRPLSYSSLRTYTKCPLRWKFRYRDGHPPATTPAQALGKGLHAALEHQHQSGTRTAGALLKGFEKAVENDPAMSDALLAKGKAILSVHHNRERSERPRIVGVERPFMIEIEGVPFRGIVDRLEAAHRGVDVVDLKTGGHLGTWSARKSRQLGFYQMGVEEDFGLRVSGLALVNLTTGERWRSPRRTERELDDLRTLVLDTQTAIEGESFEPKLNADCPCEYANRCPFFLDKFPKVDDWTGDERARIAPVVDRFAAERNPADAEALHDYMQSAGVRRAWGRRNLVDRIRSEKRAWDLEEAARALGKLQATETDVKRALENPGTPPRLRHRLKTTRKVVGERWTLRARALDPIVQQ